MKKENAVEILTYLKTPSGVDLKELCVDAERDKISGEEIETVTVGINSLAPAKSKTSLMIDCPSTLDTAKMYVCGQLQEDYGTPKDNFQWSAYKDTAFISLDVTTIMSLLQIARVKAGAVAVSSFIDMAGYVACGGEVSRFK